MTADYRVYWKLGVVVPASVKVEHTTEKAKLYSTRTGVLIGEEMLRRYTCTIKFSHPANHTFVCTLLEGDDDFSPDNTDILEGQLEEWLKETFNVGGNILGRGKRSYNTNGEWAELYFLGIEVDHNNLWDYNGRVLDPDSIHPGRVWWRERVSEELREAPIEIRPIIYIG